MRLQMRCQNSRAAHARTSARPPPCAYNSSLASKVWNFESLLFSLILDTDTCRGTIVSGTAASVLLCCFLLLLLLHAAFCTYEQVGWKARTRQREHAPHSRAGDHGMMRVRRAGTGYQEQNCGEKVANAARRVDGSLVQRRPHIRIHALASVLRSTLPHVRQTHTHTHTHTDTRTHTHKRERERERPCRGPRMAFRRNRRLCPPCMAARR